MTKRVRTRAPVVVLALVAMLAAGCASTSQLRDSQRPTDCVLDDQIAGTWKSFRMSQLGPAWTRYSLRCDCTYTSRVRLLWMGLVEHGSYHARDGELRFFRPSAETTMPYRLDADRLVLQEHPTEEHGYERTDRLVCEAPET